MSLSKKGSAMSRGGPLHSQSPFVRPDMISSKAVIQHQVMRPCPAWHKIGISVFIEHQSILHKYHQLRISACWYHVLNYPLEGITQLDYGMYWVYWLHNQVMQDNHQLGWELIELDSYKAYKEYIIPNLNNEAWPACIVQRTRESSLSKIILCIHGTQDSWMWSSEKDQPWP